MSKKFRTALAAAGTAVLMATGFTAGTASAAQTGAAESWEDCSPGHVCLWDGAGFSGELILAWRPQRRGQLLNFPDRALDRASSIRNNSGFDVRLHNLRNAMGVGSHCFRARTGHGDLRLLGLDNVARSATTPFHC